MQSCVRACKGALHDVEPAITSHLHSLTHHLFGVDSILQAPLTVLTTSQCGATNSMTKWKHPEAVMRLRIQGKSPTCMECIHLSVFTLDIWCNLHDRDPCPGYGMSKTYCEHFNTKMETP